MAMKDSRRDSIIDDLLVKFPKGAKRKLKKHDYHSDREYCYNTDRYKHFVKTTDTSKNFGYSMLTIFDLNLRSEGAIRKYVERRFYKGQTTHRGGYGGHQGGVTRKSNRLWSRIEPALAQIKESSVTGVYKLSSRWGTALGHIHAGSPEEARNVGLAMFAHVLEENEKNRLTAELVSRADIQDVLRFNKTIFTNSRDEIKGLHDTIKSTKLQIEKRKQRLEAMIMLEHLLLEKSEEKEEKKSK